MKKLSKKYTKEVPQPLKSLNDEYGDTTKVEREIFKEIRRHRRQSGYSRIGRNNV